MKRTKLGLILIASMMSLGAMTACNGGGTSTSQTEEFDFTITLESGSNEIFVGSTDQIVISDNGVGPEVKRSYSYKSSKTDYAVVDSAGIITAKAPGTVTFTVSEKVSNVNAKLNVTIRAAADPANGGFNYAAASGEAAIKNRTDILGKLEKYAMDSHLTGITLFENGGYVRYSDRVKLPTDEYITGYGFGLTSEGSIDETKPFDGETNIHLKPYVHTATSQDPATINAWNATGSQVSDLSSYITSTYWGTKMNADHNGYDWYPVLAKDKVNGVDYKYPTAIYEKENPLGLYTTWRIYVKTGETDGLRYRQLVSANPNELTEEQIRLGIDTKAGPFDGRLVKIEDYEFVYQLLLSGPSQMSRGAEIAGDKTYGIKGAQKFYNNSKNYTTVEQLDNTWKDMQEKDNLGIHTGYDESVGSYYIQLELINAIDQFTAMYTLSSSLYSPIPREFIESLDTNKRYFEGAKIYGTFSDGSILDHTICVGPYVLEGWNKKQRTLFTRNNDWFEVSDQRYLVKGVVINVYPGANENENLIYEQFKAGKIDSTGIPTKYLNEEISKGGLKQTKGDSTFKLNVNSCTKERWNYLFGPEGKINKGSNWNVKPWMSNDNFIKGLFYSIDREAFAKKRGVQPSINYFSDAYMIDPEHGVSYNSTEQHKEAVKNYHTVRDGKDNFGYNLDKAVQCFKTAVNQLVKSGDITKGSVTNPTEITIQIEWMYQTDTEEYGADIKSYFETAFNNEAVSGGTVKLNVLQHAATYWEDVYNEQLMKGQFDLGFGAISGNTYNPLNFMEVLKSDNSSGFTLNWGADTSKIDTIHNLVYGETPETERSWSFDALWSVADHGGVVEKGSIVNNIKACYIDKIKTLDGAQETDLLRDGAIVTIPYSFVSVPDVEFEITGLEIFMTGAGNIKFTSSEFKVESDKVVLTISTTRGQEINEEIMKAMKVDDPSKEEKYEPDAFRWGRYREYFTFEFYYTISIKKGTPTQNYITVGKNVNDDIYAV